MQLFMENEEGVHVMQGGGGEYTACGDAIDINAVDSTIDRMVPTTKKVVTCQRCIEVVKYFRGIRIKEYKRDK